MILEKTLEFCALLGASSLATYYVAPFLRSRKRNASVETISVNAGDIVNPASDTSVTFVNLTSEGSVYGTLKPGPDVNGFVKHIILRSAVDNAVYKLICPDGLFLDPGTSTTTTKIIDFTSAGQSVCLIWDNDSKMYF